MAVAGREVEVAEHLPGQLRLAIDGRRLGQVEQAVQYAQRRRHVLVLQRVLPFQVVAGKVLAAEALERRVLGLACLMHPVDGLDQHLVLRLKVSQAVANLLRHTVVVRVRQTRQIVCCQILVCHNSVRLLRLLLMFLSAGRSDDPLLPRSSIAEVSDAPLSPRSSIAGVSEDSLRPRSSTAEVSEDSLRPRSSVAEVSEDSLRPRSSVAERAESVLLPLSTASRRRAPFFMVRLVPMHIRFVSFSVDVLFQSAARFPGLKREREGGAVRRGFRGRPLRGGCAGGGPPCAGHL